MSQEILSAMLDGECSSEEIKTLLDTAEDPAALAAKWARLCLASEVVSGKTSVRAPADFCAVVMAKLGQLDYRESAVVVPFPVSGSKPAVVPQSRVEAASVVREMPVQQAPMRRQSRFRRDLARPLVGLAAAASLAFVATIAGRSVLGGHSDAQPQVAVSLPSPGSQQVALSLTSAPSAGLVKVSSQEPAELGWSQLDEESARELNEYLAQHNNYGADQGLGGPLGAGRMAMRTADYRPAAGSN